MFFVKNHGRRLSQKSFICGRRKNSQNLTLSTVQAMSIRSSFRSGGEIWSNIMLLKKAGSLEFTVPGRTAKSRCIDFPALSSNPFPVWKMLKNIWALKLNRSRRKLRQWIAPFPPPTWTALTIQPREYMAMVDLLWLMGKDILFSEMVLIQKWLLCVMSLVKSKDAWQR